MHQILEDFHIINFWRGPCSKTALPSGHHTGEIVATVIGSCMRYRQFFLMNTARQLIQTCLTLLLSNAFLTIAISQCIPESNI